MIGRIIQGSFAQPSSGAAHPHSGDSLRLVSWNIERGKHATEVGKFVESVNADICVFQEVDFNVRRTHNRHIAEEIARAARHNYAFSAAFREVTHGAGAFHGQAIFSRREILRPRVIQFRYQSTFWKPRWWVPDTPPFQEREGGRIALVAEIPFDGKHIVVYNLHLESRGPEKLRALQLEEVVQDAGRYPASTPIVIAGDLNTKRRWSPCIELMRKSGFADAIGDPQRFTTSRGGALARLFIDGALDWIWVRGLGHKDGQMHRAIRASDHFPLSAILAPNQAI